MELHVDWLRLIRVLTQYVAPGLVTIVLVAEITDGLGGALVLPTVAIAYNCSVLIVFSLLTTIMIGIFGWIVFLWDIDRLFFKLENKIDSQMMVMEMKSGESGQDGTLLGRARDMLNNIVQSSRAMAVGSIEKSYWVDISAGGLLAFPKPNIAAAVEQIEKSRRDLLAPLTELVSHAIPLGSVSAPYRVAPDLQVFCAGDQSAPLSPPRVAVPLTAWRALRPHRHMLLRQHLGVVARERVGIQPGLRLVDESRSLSAGFDAARAPIKSVEPISFRPGQIAGHGGSQRNVSRAFTSVAHISSHALQLGVGSATTRLPL